ncbi:MAG: hypothetical protein VW405_02350 [Rhodospirillaceae bacterium]
MLILPGDVAAQIQKRSHEIIGERYGERQVENVIPRLFEVLPVSEMSHGHYHRETLEVAEGYDVREMGEKIDAKTIREEITALCKLRFVAGYYEIPREMLEYVKLGQDRAFMDMQSWAASKASVFADKRFDTEQTEAAKFFSRGGYTAGDPIFNNTPKGGESDSGGDFPHTGKPLFALTGNNWTNTNGSTYFNSVALNLTATNLGTLENRQADSNGYTQMGERLNTMPNVLWCGQSLRQTAEQIVNARALAGVTDNDANPYSSYEIVIHPYITDTDAWGLGKARTGIRWFQDDRAPTVELGYHPQKRTDCLVIQSAFGLYVRPHGQHYWSASNLSTS